MYRTATPWMGAPTQNFIHGSTAGIGSLGEPQKALEEPEFTAEFLEEGMEEEKG
jgi:hypothetical protein